VTALLTDRIGCAETSVLLEGRFRRVSLMRCTHT
jgi:hypothetical protein